MFVAELTSKAYSKAAELIERMKKVNPDAPELLFADMLIDLGQNKTAEAEARLRAIIKAQPNSQAFFLLGQVLSDENKLEEAVAALNRSLEIKPTQPSCCILLA